MSQLKNGRGGGDGVELRGGGAYENSLNHEGLSTAHIMPLILTNSLYEKEKKKYIFQEM